MFRSAEGGLAPEVCRSGRSSGPRAAGSTESPGPRKGLPRRSVHRFQERGQRHQFAKKRAEEIKGFGPDYAYKPARVDPDLRLWIVPEGFGGAPPRPGLVSPEKFAREVERRGLGGMPKSGFKRVRSLLSLLEQFRSHLGFWHVTLPDEDYEDLLRLGTWSTFQRRLFDRLVQYLTLHGDPALVCGVCEIGEIRLARTSRPMPHLHIVTSGWNVRAEKGKWLLRPEILDEITQKACADAGLPPRPRQAASRIEPIRHSVRGYVSKYVTKGSGVPGKCLEDGWDALIPHQWWNRSDALHKLWQGHLFHLPPAFVAFVSQQRQRLETARLGVGHVAVVGHRKTLTGDLPIEVECFQFWGAEQLILCFELFLWWVQDPAAWDEGGEACESMAAYARQNRSLPLPDLITPIRNAWMGSVIRVIAGVNMPRFGWHPHIPFYLMTSRSEFNAGPVRLDNYA